MSDSKKSVEQIEQERLTRRQALRKLGFGAGMSAIMLLGVDDLARMVGKRMAQMDGDNMAADQIAKEFQSAGVALADGGSTCQHCCNQLAVDDDYCGKQPQAQQNNCYCVKWHNFQACSNANCAPNGSCTFPPGSVITIPSCTAD